MSAENGWELIGFDENIFVILCLLHGMDGWITLTFKSASAINIAAGTTLGSYR